MRRLKLDLIMIYKICNNFVDLNANELFTFSHSNTRGHCKKIVKQQCKLQCRYNSFSNRSVNAWNSLPSQVIDCETVTDFKKRLATVNFDKFLLSRPN